MTAKSTSVPSWDADVTELAQHRSALEPSDRGTLTVADKVIDKIAAHAASLVMGVVPAGSALDKVTGRTLPRASSQVRGRQARVIVRVAVAWPQPLATIATRVRSTVAHELSRLSSLDVVGVDVTVDRIELQDDAFRWRVE